MFIVVCTWPTSTLGAPGVRWCARSTVRRNATRRDTWSVLLVPPILHTTQKKVKGRPRDSVVAVESLLALFRRVGVGTYSQSSSGDRNVVALILPFSTKQVYEESPIVVVTVRSSCCRTFYSQRPAQRRGEVVAFEVPTNEEGSLLPPVSLAAFLG